MDALLHFPHVILSGEKLIVWNAPGQMPASFFEDLARTTGWDRTFYVERRPVLVSAHKAAPRADHGGLARPPAATSGLGGVVVVGDDDALAAMRVAFAEFGLVAKPGGAIALAAVISGRFPIAGRTVAVALTEANVDPALYARVIGGGQTS